MTVKQLLDLHRCGLNRPMVIICYNNNSAKNFYAFSQWKYNDLTVDYFTIDSDTEDIYLNIHVKESDESKRVFRRK